MSQQRAFEVNDSSTNDETLGNVLSWPHSTMRRAFCDAHPYRDVFAPLFKHHFATKPINPITIGRNCIQLKNPRYRQLNPFAEWRPQILMPLPPSPSTFPPPVSCRRWRRDPGAAAGSGSRSHLCATKFARGYLCIAGAGKSKAIVKWCFGRPFIAAVSFIDGSQHIFGHPFVLSQPHAPCRLGRSTPGAPDRSALSLHRQTRCSQLSSACSPI